MTINNKYVYWLSLWVLIFSIACGGQVDTTGQEADNVVTESYPQTPEEVVRRYQAYIDSNYFAQAQQLSTVRSAPLHEMMAEIVANTPADSSLIHTEFLDIQCTTEQDTAVCICRLRDEYETYQSEYILVRVDGRWLVDLPEETGEVELDEETMEQWPEQQ